MGIEFEWAKKHPNTTDNRFIIMCDIDGTNDGSTGDDGELQGATISSVGTITFSPASELASTGGTSGTVTIEGVSYSINTVVTVPLTGGTDGTKYVVTVPMTLSDSRVLNKVCHIVVTSGVEGL